MYSFKDTEFTDLFCVFIPVSPQTPFIFVNFPTWNLQQELFLINLKVFENKTWTFFQTADCLIQLTTSENIIIYHNALCLSPQNFAFFISIVFSFSWKLKWAQEKLKTMLMQTFGVTNKEHYGMLWYFLKWLI